MNILKIKQYVKKKLRQAYSTKQNLMRIHSLYLVDITKFEKKKYNVI